MGTVALKLVGSHPPYTQRQHKQLGAKAGRFPTDKGVLEAKLCRKYGTSIAREREHGNVEMAWLRLPVRKMLKELGI